MAALMDDRRLLAPRRVGLLEAMRARPGLTFRGLAKAAGMAAGSCAHHVRVLERHGLSWSVGHGFRRRHFPGSRPAPDVADYLARVASLDPGMHRVLAFVQAKPGCAQKDVIAAFPDKPHSTTQHVLGRLEREGFVSRTFAGRCARHVAVDPPAQVRITLAGTGGYAQGVGHTLACAFPVMAPHAMATVPTEVTA